MTDTSQRTQSASIIKDRWLIIFHETVGVYFEDYKEHIEYNAMQYNICNVQEKQLVRVRESGIRSRHWTLKG